MRFKKPLKAVPSDLFLIAEKALLRGPIFPWVSPMRKNLRGQAAISTSAAQTNSWNFCLPVCSESSYDHYVSSLLSHTKIVPFPHALFVTNQPPLHLLCLDFILTATHSGTSCSLYLDNLLPADLAALLSWNSCTV